MRPLHSIHVVVKRMEYVPTRLLCVRIGTIIDPRPVPILIVT